MLQVLLIVLVGVVLAHDALPAQELSDPSWPGWVLGAAAPCAIWFAAHAGIAWCGRQIDRSGAWRAFALAERMLAAMRLALVAAFVSAVLWSGWLVQVRELVGGNLIVIDEAVALAPTFIALTLGWWSYEPIEQRLRSATVLRELEGKGHLESAPERWGYVLEQARHQLLIVIVPLALIAAWAETVDKATKLAGGRWEWLQSDWGAALIGAVHIGGVLAIMALMPLGLRVLWRTTPLGPGPLRESLTGLCRRQEVRCREVLVWHTHSGMLNGAVIGVLPWLRYILLTDALLDSLESKQVEAVMAHEVAHARRHHLPWLIAVLVGAGALGWAGAGLLLGPPEGAGGSHAMLEAILPLSAAAGLGLLVLGFVSRRFEEQADAFAVQHLSGWSAARRDSSGPTVSAEAAEAMAGALGMVAAMNHIPRERFTFRHGSIAGRQAKIRALVGQDSDRLPIDRTVVVIKAGAALLLAGGIGLAVFDALGLLTGPA